MSDQSAEEVVLRKYLLAELDEQQREQIEERLFCDEGFADELAAAESSLIDDYVFAALSQADREKFEQNFILNDERRRNLRLAQAFDSYLDPESSSETAEAENSHPWWKNFWVWLNAHKAWMALPAAVAVIAVIFITPNIVKWFNRTDQVSSLQAQRATIERQLAELNRRPFATQSLTLPSRELTLQPALLRGGGSENERVEITKDVLLSLRLALPSSQYDKYTVLFSTIEDGDLFSINDVPASDENGVATILLRIPAEHLSTNDYQLDVKGIAADGSQQQIARYNLPITSAQNSP